MKSSALDKVLVGMLMPDFFALCRAMYIQPVTDKSPE